MPGKRYLTPGVPGYLSPVRRHTLQPQQINPADHLGDPNPPGHGDKLNLLGLVWATWNESAPTDVSQLVTSSTKKGFNWAIWQTALTLRIQARGGTVADEIKESGDFVHFEREAVLDLCSMFDTVILGHWLPLGFCSSIKARSTAPGGTTILFWSDFESINQKRPFTDEQVESFFQGRNNGLTALGGTPNGYGCSGIDKFESAPQPAGSVACFHDPLEAGLPSEASVQTSHNWDVDIDLTTIALEEYVEVGFLEQTESWGAAFDGYVFDNLLEFPFKGSATNDYPAGWTTLYRAGWIAFLAAMRTFHRISLAHVDEAARVWGNGPLGTTVYTRDQARGRYVEHYFRSGATDPKEWTEIEADIKALVANGTHIIIAGNGTVGLTNYWAETSGGATPGLHGQWSQIVNTIRAQGVVDQVHVAACQTLASAHIFWQDGFRVPT